MLLLMDLICMVIIPDMRGYVIVNGPDMRGYVIVNEPDMRGYNTGYVWLCYIIKCY